jgi:hypothetical protein
MADLRKPNSFHTLMEEYEQKFSLPEMQSIENKLQRSKEGYRFAGDVVDLFLPKILSTVSAMFGGESGASSKGRVSNPASGDQPNASWNSSKLPGQ